MHRDERGPTINATRSCVCGFPFAVVPAASAAQGVAVDAEQVAILERYRALTPLAREARRVAYRQRHPQIEYHHFDRRSSDIKQPLRPMLFTRAKDARRITQ